MVKKVKIVASLIWAISAVAIIYGSLSHQAVVPEKYALDKFIHGGAYAGLAFLSFFFIHNHKYLAAFLVMLVLLGGGIEITQTYMPPRTGTIGDFGADFAGVIIGSLIAAKLKPLIFGWIKK